MSGAVMEAMKTALISASFYPTLLYNVTLHALGVRPCYSRIDETVVLGALPVSDTRITEIITGEGVTGVVSVCSEHELRWCGGWGRWGGGGAAWDRCSGDKVQHLHLPVTDLIHSLTLTQVQRGVAFITDIQQNTPPGGSVYVHCKAGRTRSATLVCCYLMQRHGWGPEQAWQHVKGRRPHVLLRAAHWQTLNHWHSHYQRSPHPPET